MAKNVLENCLSVWCNVLPKYLEVFDEKKNLKFWFVSQIFKTCATKSSSK